MNLITKRCRKRFHVFCTFLFSSQQYAPRRSQARSEQDKARRCRYPTAYLAYAEFVCEEQRRIAPRTARMQETSKVMALSFAARNSKIPSFTRQLPRKARDVYLHKRATAYLAYAEFVYKEQRRIAPPRRSHARSEQDKARRCRHPKASLALVEG